MNRGCSRNSVWLCRAMVLFNVACLTYLGYHFYYGSSQPPRTAALPALPDSQATAARARGSGVRWGAQAQNHLPPLMRLPASAARADDDDLVEDELKPPRPPLRQPRRPPKFEKAAEEPGEAADPPARPKPAAARRPPVAAAEAAAAAPVPEAPAAAAKDEDVAGPSDRLKVFIVEEHHEVLPYWHGAFEAESKRRRSNLPPLSLVHIDGHSDGAPILPDKRYPYKTERGTAHQIKYLMTSNDNFVMGSRAAGLVSHAVWVYPKWCSINGTELEIFTAGVSKINGTLQGCSCPHYEADRHPLLTPALNTTDTCSMDTRIMEMKRLWFNQKFCYFRKGPFLQLFAPEDKITKEVLHSTLTRRLQLPTARPESENIGTLYQPVTSTAGHNDYILDIDEDYFGVQLAGRQTLDAGIPMDTMAKVRHPLEALFCPEVTGAEVLADRWFVALLAKIGKVNAKCSGEDAGEGDCSKSAMAQEVASDASLNLLLRAAVCKQMPASQRRPMVAMLTRQLLSLTREQLRVVQSVGLCLGMSLKTNLEPMYRLSSGGGKGRRRSIVAPEPVVKVCLGHNTPNESVVQEFVDTRAGIDARMALMTDILRHLPKPPVAITICRSSRDGYVPRQQMTYIEAGVLASLRAVFGQVDVTYDPDLFHGREGWFRYKARQLGEDFRWPGVKL